MPQLDRRSFVLAGAAVSAATPALPSAALAATSSEKFPTLFSPIELGGFRLKNRVVNAAMSTRFVDKGVPTEALINYHANRARGGAAMVISEPVNVMARQTSPRRVHVYSNPPGDGLKRWAEAVERHDCRMLLQVQDSGRGRNEPGRNMEAFGVSALPDDLSWTMPHTLDTDEVARSIDEIATSARIAREAGFSGVEISAGHGHLFHQFLSAQANKRTDRFGGDLDGRARFLTETLSAIRAAVGAKFIIGVKLPGEDGVEGGIDLKQAAAITALVHRTGAASYITYCWGAHAETLYTHLPDNHGPVTPYVETIRDLATSAPGVPVAALGLITRAEQAESILTGKKADLIMIGRPMVADPAWAKKSSEGRIDQIRHCVSCNSCWATINTGANIRCDNNPRIETPDEVDWWPKQAEKKKRVVVVGGGIAGLEAAWVAAARGHTVTLFSASKDVGGKTRVHSGLPGGRGLANIFDFQRASAARFGVKLELGTTATAAAVLELKPDAVIMATGATMIRPAFLKFGGEEILDLRQAAADVAANISRRRSGAAVIYDQDHTAMTYAAAELFKEVFDRVVIVTPRERIAGDEAVVTRQAIYRRLAQKKIEIITSMAPLAGSAFKTGAINLGNVYSDETRMIDGVTLFTYATSRAGNTALESDLRARGIAPVLVGDCFAGRTVMTAVTEGHKAGMAV